MPTGDLANKLANWVVELQTNNTIVKAEQACDAIVNGFSLHGVGGVRRRQFDSRLKPALTCSVYVNCDVICVFRCYICMVKDYCTYGATALIWTDHISGDVAVC